MDKNIVISAISELIMDEFDIRDPYMVGYQHALRAAIEKINGLTTRAADTCLNCGGKGIVWDDDDEKEYTCSACEGKRS